MRRASDYTRELASGIADLNTRRSEPGHLLGSVIGFTLIFALACAVVYGLLLDCRGASC